MQKPSHDRKDVGYVKRWNLLQLSITPCSLEKRAKLEKRAPNVFGEFGAGLRLHAFSYLS